MQSAISAEHRDQVEILRFAMYLAVPTASILYFGDPEWYDRYVVPVSGASACGRGRGRGRGRERGCGGTSYRLLTAPFALVWQEDLARL